jgi:predicted RNase H-like HicB family nuclease
MTYTFKPTLQKEDDDHWSAWIKALPGCTAWGYTKEDALQCLKEAAEVVVEDMIACGEDIPVEAG